MRENVTKSPTSKNSDNMTSQKDTPNHLKNQNVSQKPSRDQVYIPEHDIE